MSKTQLALMGLSLCTLILAVEPAMAWVALVVVGAFLVFAGPAVVANLRSSFS
jgi:hypothetical protein